jgi:hypothetical protein
LNLKTVKPHQFKHVNFDTTVQEKDVRFPADGGPYDRVTQRLVDAAKERKIKYRQNCNRNSKHLPAQQSRYAHVRQMKRAKSCSRKLRTYLGRVNRDIEGKYPVPDSDLQREHRMDRNRLKGVPGDRINAILSASRMNSKNLLRCVADFLRQIYFGLFFCQRTETVEVLIIK